MTSNDYLLPWGATPLRLDGPAQARAAATEVSRRPVFWASVAASVALVVLALGLLTPPTYTSSTTLLVENSTILPAGDQRGVSTASNHAVVAREVAFSRRVMEQVLEAGGWTASNPSAVEKNELIRGIISRTTIDVSDRSRGPNATNGVNVIKVDYSDSDPQRAFRVARRLAELLISESKARKQEESRAALQFLDSQVAEYQGKLGESGESLRQYQLAHPNASPDLEGGVNSRIAELRREVDNARLDLAGSATQEGQLQSMLSRESELGGGISRASQFRSRVAELEAERNRLTAQYTNRHPDVVRIQNELNGLSRQGASAVAGSQLAGTINPMHGQLRMRLADARRERAAAASRIAAGQALLNAEMARDRESLSTESTLGALVRDHETNRELYQDLVKRREAARVAANLDAAGQGLNYRIQEPARVPLSRSGLSLTHFAIAGLVLAIALPMLLLAALVKHDPRARTPLQIERDAGLPVLGTIPLHHNRKQQAVVSRRYFLATAVLLSIPVVYGLVLAARMVNGS